MGNQLVAVDIQGLEQLKAMARILQPAVWDKALTDGVRYAAKAAGPSVAKQISSRYSITSGRVKQDVKGPFVRNIGQNAVAQLSFSRRAPTAAQFKPKRVGANLQISIFKGEKTIIEHGYIGTAKGRSLPVVPVRNSVYKPDMGVRLRNKLRQTIAVIHGPSIGSIYGGQSRYGSVIRNEVNNRINEQFITGVDRAIAAAARGFGGKR